MRSRITSREPYLRVRIPESVLAGQWSQWGRLHFADQESPKTVRD